MINNEKALLAVPPKLLQPGGEVKWLRCFQFAGARGGGRPLYSYSAATICKAACLHGMAVRNSMSVGAAPHSHRLSRSSVLLLLGLRHQLPDIYTEDRRSSNTSKRDFDQRDFEQRWTPFSSLGNPRLRKGSRSTTTLPKAPLPLSMSLEPKVLDVAYKEASSPCQALR